MPARRTFLLSLCSILILPVTAATAGQIQLNGTIRDFKVGHPDMQKPGNRIGVVKNMVLDDLGEDDKPILTSQPLPNKARITSASTFDQWFRDVEGVNIPIPYSITLDNGQEEPGGIYSFSVEKPVYFFPIDGQGWGDTATDKNGNQRNFYFTFEIHTQFTYIDPADRDHALLFSFTGDDDVWVFVNGKLVVDIGGVHRQASDWVNLDDEAEALGLEPGGTYKLDFFFAERHTSESNFRIETTIQPDPAPNKITALYD